MRLEGARRWRPTLAASLGQLAGTVGAFVALVGISYAWMPGSKALGVLVAALAGIALVRVFIIQHDCAHRSYFVGRAANDVVGTALGVLTLAPHAYWRAMHITHHATSGNLDRRGHGDMPTLTVTEYEALARRAQLFYRVYRSPIGLVVIGPIYQFLLRWRVPADPGVPGSSERRSTAITNLGLVLIYALFLAFGDVARFLLVHLVIVQVSGGIGILLFFVQHQIERPYWVRRVAWSAKDAALIGSSHFVLPRLLEWLVGSINLHHVHHLRPDVPNFLLRAYMESGAHPRAASELCFRDALGGFRLKLFDEKRGVMVGFPTR